MMRYDVKCEQCGKSSEIEKPMRARWPACEHCGGPVKRVWKSSASVHYAAGGFYSTDTKRMEGLIGTEQAAKLKARNDDALKRAHDGKLTEYEKSLEQI